MAYLHLNIIHSVQIMIDTLNVHFSRGFPRSFPFDSLGFLSTFVIQEEVWLTGSDWDEPLPRHLNDKTTKWQKDLTKLLII